MTPRIRPIEKTDLASFYGEEPLDTIRGLALVDDENVLAIGGLMYSRPLQAFSDIRPEAKRYPRLLVKMGREVCRIYERCCTPVVAVVDKRHPNSPVFLERLGFQRVNEELYVWRTQQS